MGTIYQYQDQNVTGSGGGFLPQDREAFKKKLLIIVGIGVFVTILMVLLVVFFGSEEPQNTESEQKEMLASVAGLYLNSLAKKDYDAVQGLTAENSSSKSLSREEFLQLIDLSGIDYSSCEVDQRSISYTAGAISALDARCDQTTLKVSLVQEDGLWRVYLLT